MMTRMLRNSAMILCLAVLSGCASLSPFSLSESQLEGYLADAISDFDRQQLRSGSPLSITLNNADITLGPDGRDVALLDVSGQVAVNALMARLPVDLVLKLEGAPVYDREEKAVYLRRLKLLESRVESSLFDGDLTPLADNLMRVVAQFLEQQPVYRLDDSSLGQRILGMVPSDIRVAPGRLEFVTGD